MAADCSHGKTVLEEPFTAIKIKGAIDDLGSNKAPGLDGYAGEFLKKAWNTVTGEILKVFQDFFESGILNCCVNETYICLVPKQAHITKV